MAVKFKHSDEYTLYFCTFTCYKWLPLFEVTDTYHKVYEWFDILKKDEIDIIGYVIMPNHVHYIIYFSKPGFDINKIMGNAKRFMAYEIINRLEESKNFELLYFLQSALTEREKKKHQLHKVFKNSFDAKPLYSEKFLFQKLNYIHANPVTGKWTLAKNDTSYVHSSASFYEYGHSAHFIPKHYKDI